VRRHAFLYLIVPANPRHRAVRSESAALTVHARQYVSVSASYLIKPRCTVHRRRAQARAGKVRVRVRQGKAQVRITCIAVDGSSHTGDATPRRVQASARVRLRTCVLMDRPTGCHARRCACAQVSGAACGTRVDDQTSPARAYVRMRGSTADTAPLIVPRPRCATRRAAGACVRACARMRYCMQAYGSNPRPRSTRCAAGACVRVRASVSAYGCVYGLSWRPARAGQACACVRCACARARAW
jgi:hypothetical protein